MKEQKAQSSLLETLKKQVGELDMETSEETVTEKIATAARKAPVITAKTSGGVTRKKTDGLDEKTIHLLSDADLTEMLKEA